MSVGVSEALLVLINLACVLIPIAVLVVVVVLFNQKLQRIEEKLDTILENQAGQAEDLPEPL